MKEILRYVMIAVLIYLAAGGSFELGNAFTGAKAPVMVASEEEAGLKEVLPQAWCFEAVKGAGQVIYYKAYDRQGRFIGTAFKASAKGYSSTIETLVGMRKDGLINAIKVIAQNETALVGARVTEADFARRFMQKKFSDIRGVEAITGASISSRAVIEAVGKKAEEIAGLIKNER